VRVNLEGSGRTRLQHPPPTLSIARVETEQRGEAHEVIQYPDARRSMTPGGVHAPALAHTPARDALHLNTGPPTVGCNNVSTRLIVPKRSGQRRSTAVGEFGHGNRRDWHMIRLHSVTAGPRSQGTTLVHEALLSFAVSPLGGMQPTRPDDPPVEYGNLLRRHCGKRAGARARASQWRSRSIWMDVQEEINTCPLLRLILRMG
jgi:hypothetical protein